MSIFEQSRYIHTVVHRFITNMKALPFQTISNTIKVYIGVLMHSLIYYLVPFALEKLDHQSTYSSIICCIVAFFIVFIVINVLLCRQDLA